jgi:hypothetical protein
VESPDRQEHGRRVVVQSRARELRSLGVLGAVRCPVLVLAGEDDPVCPLPVVEELARRLPAETTRLVRLPGAPHHLPGPAGPRFPGRAGLRLPERGEPGRRLRPVEDCGLTSQAPLLTAILFRLFSEMVAFVSGALINKGAGAHLSRGRCENVHSQSSATSPHVSGRDSRNSRTARHARYRVKRNSRDAGANNCIGVRIDECVRHRIRDYRDDTRDQHLLYFLLELGTGAYFLSGIVKSTYLWDRADCNPGKSIGAAISR